MTAGERLLARMVALGRVSLGGQNRLCIEPYNQRRDGANFEIGPEDFPNRLGVSVCRLISVSGVTLMVAALDAIDGTPVLDLKPYMMEFAPRETVRQPTWSHELMAGYWSEK